MAQGEDWACRGKGCPADVTKQRKPTQLQQSLAADEWQPRDCWGSFWFRAVVFSFPLAICLQPLLETGYWVGQTFGLTQLAWCPVQPQEMSVVKELNGNKMFSEKVGVLLRYGQGWCLTELGRCVQTYQEINRIFNKRDKQILPLMNRSMFSFGLGRHLLCTQMYDWKD